MKGEKIIIKKIISLVVPIILIIILSVTFFTKWNMRMVTGSAKDLNKITITIPDDYYQGKQFVLETEAELTELYNILKKTKNKRFGSHEGGGALQINGNYRIDLFYSTGKTEIVRGGNSNDFVFKNNVNLLFSRKFLRGENQLLPEYIDTLMSSCNRKY